MRIPRRYSVNFALFSILLDIISISISLILTDIIDYWFEISLPHLESSGIQLISFRFFFVFPIIWILLNFFLSVYDGRRNIRFYNEYIRLAVSTFFATLSLAGILFFFYQETAYHFFITFILFAVIFMYSWRVIIRLYWRHLNAQGLELRRLLIIGAGEVGKRVARTISSPRYKNYQFLGFVDDYVENTKGKVEVLGTLSDLESIVGSYGINIIVITLSADAYGITANIVDRMRMKPVKIWIVPEANRLARFQSDIEYLADIPTLDIRASAISDEQRLRKRIFDLIIASIVILFAAPLMIICAILIKLDSRGPILFRQKRIGENMQPFEMFKFRTMVENAESLHSLVATRDEHGNIIHKHPNDPRVTRIGHFLRKYSLDELPQFFNVLRGNMSIVGPRPELPFLVENYSSWQYVRFTIPQGITGWWQVSGRSNKPMHLNTDADFYYINHYSFWLDIKIILKTIITTLSGKGAF